MSSVPPPNGQPSAGWYPVDALTQRYWDGELWTDNVAPIAPPSAPTPTHAPSHQYPPPPQSVALVGGVSSDDRTYSLLLHLSPFVAPLLGPLIMWLIKRNESEFIDHHGKEAMNFALTMLIAVIVSFVLVFVLIGFFLLLALSVIGILFPILAAVAANRGERYRYPVAIRFFS